MTEDQLRKELEDKTTRDLLIELVIVNKETNRHLASGYRWLLLAVIILAVGSKGMEWYDKVIGKANAEVHEQE